MGIIVRTATIAASPDRIWAILAALDRYADWESGYASSQYTSDRHDGVGATRDVRLRSPMGVRRATHEVTRWDEPSAIAWAARSNNFPMLKAAEQTVTLTPEGDGTRVENRVEYELSMGPIGRFTDMVMFRRVVRGAADGFLESLAAATRD